MKLRTFFFEGFCIHTLLLLLLGLDVRTNACLFSVALAICWMACVVTPFIEDVLECMSRHKRWLSSFRTPSPRDHSMGQDAGERHSGDCDEVDAR